MCGASHHFACAGRNLLVLCDARAVTETLRQQDFRKNQTGDRRQQIPAGSQYAAVMPATIRLFVKSGGWCIASPDRSDALVKPSSPRGFRCSAAYSSTATRPCVATGLGSSAVAGTTCTGRDRLRELYDNEELFSGIDRPAA